MNPDELKQLVVGVRQVEKAIGDVFYPYEGSSARRCVYLVKDVQAGEVLTMDHIAQMRPGGGPIAPKELKYVLGRQAAKAMSRGKQLTWEDLHR